MFEGRSVPSALEDLGRVPGHVTGVSCDQGVGSGTQAGTPGRGWPILELYYWALFGPQRTVTACPVLRDPPFPRCWSNSACRLRLPQMDGLWCDPVCFVKCWPCGRNFCCPERRLCLVISNFKKKIKHTMFQNVPAPLSELQLGEPGFCLRDFSTWGGGGI